MKDEEEPKDFKEAMSSKDAEKWKLAIERELESLHENETWTVVEVPESQVNVIENKWVFKIKRNKDGEIDQYKARLVAKGFQQKDIETSELYSPVAKLTTLRVLLAIAVQDHLPVYQMDVKSAFLYGNLDEKVFMYLPEGENQAKDNKICKLNKSIYGLKRFPRCWYEKFNSLMESEKFYRSLNDLCLYIKKDQNSKIFVLLYVDDLLILGSDDIEVNKLKSVLSANFKMKDLGLASNYLGINIEQNLKSETISINQSAYLKSVLKRFGMLDSKPVSTPIDMNFNQDILKRDISESQEIEKQCRQIIGSLMYAMLGSRPDLSVSVNILIRYQSKASKELLNNLKIVLRYIKGTVELNLVFSKNNSDIKLIGYADADWGGDQTDRKSTTGYIFFVNECLVSWSTKKQISVALSSTEAEYIALSVATCEACWLRKVIMEINHNISLDPIKIFEDNQSAIKVANNFDNNKRLKHVDIRYCFVNEKINDGIIDLCDISTENQTADIMTKPLGKTKFENFVKNLNLK